MAPGVLVSKYPILLTFLVFFPQALPPKGLELNKVCVSVCVCLVCVCLVCVCTS